MSRAKCKWCKNIFKKKTIRSLYCCGECRTNFKKSQRPPTEVSLVKLLNYQCEICGRASVVFSLTKCFCSESHRDEYFLKKRQEEAKRFYFGIKKGFCLFFIFNIDERRLIKNE